MQRPTALVVTTVHHADDTRIREKTVRSLSAVFDVTYAARTPEPADRSDLTFHPLSGGRLRRMMEASGLVLRGGHDVVSLHDPELIPLGIVATLGGRRGVVFDVHEDVPAQILTKEWVPSMLRRPIAALAAIGLRMAERRVTITLAESSYSRRFRRPHPVLSNAPRLAGKPMRNQPGDRRAIYLGDVTVRRGIFDAIEACALVGIPLEVVGPYRDLGPRLMDAATKSGVDLRLRGRLPNPAALDRVASAAVALSPLHDIPNYRHSIPTKVLEYLAAGVPVVASDLPATRSLVQGLEAVSLVAPGDASALAEGIRMMLDPTQRSKAQHQADEIRGRFSWSDEAVQRIYLHAGGGDR